MAEFYSARGWEIPPLPWTNLSPPFSDRAVPGHWEGDLIIGLGRSAIGTLVERTTRFTMLLHLPRMEGHGTVPRVKNGPALAGHGAEAVRDAIARTITTLPAQLRRSLTWDQGAEMAKHADLRIATGLPVYFCEPHRPWQRGTNENTNGLLRQYFPKGTDLSAHSPDVLAVVADALNTRPRKTSDGELPPKLWTSACRPVKLNVLRRPVEPAQYCSDAYQARLGELGFLASMSGKVFLDGSRSSVRLQSAEQTDEQPRLDIAALRDRDHPPEEMRRHPTHGDLSWLAVQEKCFGSPSVCASGRPSSAISLRIRTLPRPGT